MKQRIVYLGRLVTGTLMCAGLLTTPMLASATEDALTAEAHVNSLFQKDYGRTACR